MKKFTLNLTLILAALSATSSFASVNDTLVCGYWESEITRLSSAIERTQAEIAKCADASPIDEEARTCHELRALLSSYQFQKSSMQDRMEDYCK